MRKVANVLLVAILTGLVGQYLGWMAVPVVALIVSIGARELELRGWQAGAGAALAWAVMLVIEARGSTFPELLSSLAAVFRIPGFALIAAALLLPFALAWSTATVATAVFRKGAK